MADVGVGMGVGDVDADVDVEVERVTGRHDGAGRDATGQVASGADPEGRDGGEGRTDHEAQEPAARPGLLRGRGFRRPNLSGDLESLLQAPPRFRDALRGYDRLQVDNYVAWAEAELLAARRENDDLTTRLGAAGAELSAARRQLAHSADAQHLGRVSERIGQILQLAADEAAELTARAAAEADRVVGEATEEAERTLRAAREHEARTNAECERLLGEAHRLRSDAAAVFERAHAAAQQVAQDAAAQRDRLDAEAAEGRSREVAAARARIAEETAAARQEREAAAAAAEQRLAEVRREVAGLRRQRDQAQAELQALTEQVGVALQQLLNGWVPGAPGAPGETAVAPNVVAADPGDAAPEARPAPVAPRPMAR